MVVKKLKAKKNSSGFTLIELMVVLTILTVVAGIVVPNFDFGDSSAELRIEAQDVAYHLQSSIDDARWKECNVSATAKDGMLVFIGQSVGEWVQDKSINIKSEVQFNVSKRQLDSAKNAVKAPSDSQWLIFSNGEYVPFTLTLTLDGLKAEITGDGFNAISIKP